MKKSTKLMLQLWKNHLVLVISFAVILFLFLGYLGKSLIDSTVEQNKAASSQAVIIIEDKIKVINRFVRQISTMRPLFKFAGVDKSQINSHQSELYQLRKQIYDVGNFIDFGQYFICFDKNDVCITSYNICTDIRRFYQSVFQFDSMSRKEFFRYKENLDSNIFLPYQKVQLGDENYNGLIYHMKLYSYGSNKNSFFFVIDAAYLTRLFKPLKHSKIVIANHSGEILYTYNMEEDEIQKYRIKSGMDTEALNRKYIISDISSNYGLQFICMTPRSAILQDVWRLLWIIVIVLTGLIFLALVVSFHGAYNNSLFIRNIFLDSHNLSEREKINIYEAINRIFNNLKEDNLMLQKKMDMTTELLYKNFFSNLLNGRLEQPYDLQVYAQDIGILLEEEYGISILSLECVADEVNDSHLEQLKKYHDACCEHLTEHERDGYIISLEIGRIAVIMEKKEEQKERTMQFIEKASFILKQEEVRVSACIFDINLHLAEVRHAAVMCNARLDKESFQNNSTNFFVVNREESMAQTNYILPDEKLRVLFAAMKKGEYHASIKVFTQIFNEVLRYSQNNPDLKREFLSRIRQTILLSNEASMLLNDQNNNLFCCIRMSNTLYRFLLGNIKKVCDINEKANQNEEDQHKKEFENKVKLYIDQDLSNAELSLNYLAGKFGFAPTYFSAVFKDNMNITLSAYLENKRMKKAHELIIKSTSRLDEIARQCGYLNSNTFRRTYRRIYGINPSAMRTMQELDQTTKDNHQAVSVTETDVK